MNSLSDEPLLQASARKKVTIQIWYKKNYWKAKGPNIGYQNLVSSLTWKTEIIPQKWLRFLNLWFKFAKRMQAEKL